MWDVHGFMCARSAPSQSRRTPCMCICNASAHPAWCSKAGEGYGLEPCRGCEASVGQLRGLTERRRHSHLAAPLRHQFSPAPCRPLQAKHATQRISFDLPKRRVWMCREAAVPFEAQPVAPRKCESRSLAARRSPRALRRPPAARNDARGKGGAS
jgi:hypothetical protein